MVDQFPAPSVALRAFLDEWSYPSEDLNTPGYYGLTPIMRAALSGQRDFVRELIGLGVNVHARNDDGNTALWLACVARDKDIVNDLIDAGIEVNQRNDTGATPLMYTASSDRPELLELLLHRGADPSIANADDMRAVDLAASRRCLQLLRHTG